MKILRLISQDGGTCIPYDNYALEIRKTKHDNRVFYFIDAINTLNSNEKKYSMGIYNTREEAIKVIKLMNRTFLNSLNKDYECFKFPEEVTIYDCYIDSEYNYSGTSQIEFRER